MVIKINGGILGHNTLNTSAGDITSRLKGLREELSIKFTPNLADGELVLWLPPGSIYDVYNNVVDLTKWTHTNTSRTTNTETTTYIELAGSAASEQGFRGILEADNFSAASTFSNLQFRITLELDESLSNNSSFVQLGVLGETNTKQYDAAAGALETFDDLWECRKKSNNDWDVFINEVYIKTITPSGTDIIANLGANAGNGNHTGTLRFFEIVIDGKAFLLAATNGKTYRTPMTAI